MIEVSNSLCVFCAFPFCIQSDDDSGESSGKKRKYEHSGGKGDQWHQSGKSSKKDNDKPSKSSSSKSKPSSNHSSSSQSDENLHPSWAAKQKTAGLGTPAGKKVTFD